MRKSTKTQFKKKNYTVHCLNFTGLKHKDRLVLLQMFSRELFFFG